MSNPFYSIYSSHPFYIMTLYQMGHYFLDRRYKTGLNFSSVKLVIYISFYFYVGKSMKIGQTIWDMQQVQVIFSLSALSMDVCVSSWRKEPPLLLLLSTGSFILSVHPPTVLLHATQCIASESRMYIVCCCLPCAHHSKN